MRDLDKMDPANPLGFTQQAKIHCAYCNAAYPEDKYPGIDISAHFSWLFFPFHRWYLYFYERILGSLIGDPTFALPYWNWDNPDGGMMIPAIFNDPASPLFDTKRNQEHLPPAVLDLTLGIPGGGVSSYAETNVDPKTQVRRNLAEMYNEMIGGPRRVTDFMGQPYRAGQPMPLGPCGGTSERGSHTSMHMWVGDPREEFNQDLGNFYSAGNDPLFYSHHSNVDRMWTIWETLPTRVRKRINDPDFFNSSFLFYDETKRLVRVRVRDCLDPAKLGYTFEPSPTPWMNYRPRKKPVRANLHNISSQARTADKVFPLTLNQKIRVLVPKTTKGKADEVLVIQSIFVKLTSSVKFNVFINDEDDDALNIDRPEYAGTFGQLAMNHAHSVNRATSPGCDLNLSLTELYENIDIDDEDTAVVVAIYPIYNGQEVTIGGISIVEAPRD